MVDQEDKDEAEDTSNSMATPFLARRFAHFFSIEWRMVTNVEGGLAGQRTAFWSFMPEWLQDLEHSCAIRADRIMGACHSPIEELFFATFATLRPWTGLRPRLIPALEDAWQPLVFEWGKYRDGTWAAEISVFQQEPIDRFHVDFSVHYRDLRLAIELDGHEFHERTKEQAARDKSRDRKLTELGYRVVRFTGSEVWKDPVDCCWQVHKIIDAVGQGGMTERR